MREETKGVLAMLAACVVWGLSSLYYKALSHIPPLEVLSHRTLWSLVFFVIWMGVKGRLRDMPGALSSKSQAVWVMAAAAAITVNWFVFIYSVQSGHALEASLGYYIFPLVAVALGASVLHERLSRLQWIAVALALVAVLLLSVGLGVPPWLALMVAGSFGSYGLIKRKVHAGPVASTAAEVMCLLPLSSLYLWGVYTQGWTGISGRSSPGTFGFDISDTLMLMTSGVLTGLPLVMFSYAGKRVSYATQGLLQYVNPTIQFALAAGLYGEPFTRWHAIAFPLIWAGLALYSVATLRRARDQGRRLARSDSAVAASGATRI
ncbi:MAG: EamA family transporter RarD [Celeribacter sp.]